MTQVQYIGTAPMLADPHEGLWQPDEVADVDPEAAAVLLTRADFRSVSAPTTRVQYMGEAPLVVLPREDPWQPLEVFDVGDPDVAEVLLTRRDFRAAPE